MCKGGLLEERKNGGQFSLRESFREKISLAMKNEGDSEGWENSEDVRMLVSFRAG